MRIELIKRTNGFVRPSCWTSVSPMLIIYHPFYVWRSLRPSVCLTAYQSASLALFRFFSASVSLAVTRRNQYFSLNWTTSRAMFNKLSLAFPLPLGWRRVHPFSSYNGTHSYFALLKISRESRGKIPKGGHLEIGRNLQEYKASFVMISFIFSFFCFYFHLFTRQKSINIYMSICSVCLFMSINWPICLLFYFFI